MSVFNAFVSLMNVYIKLFEVKDDHYQMMATQSENHGKLLFSLFAPCFVLVCIFYCYFDVILSVQHHSSYSG